MGENELNVYPTHSWPRTLVLRKTEHKDYFWAAQIWSVKVAKVVPLSLHGKPWESATSDPSGQPPNPNLRINKPRNWKTMVEELMISVCPAIAESNSEIMDESSGVSWKSIFWAGHGLRLDSKMRTPTSFATFYSRKQLHEDCLRRGFHIQISKLGTWICAVWIDLWVFENLTFGPLGSQNPGLLEQRASGWWSAGKLLDHESDFWRVTPVIGIGCGPQPVTVVVQ